MAYFLSGKGRPVTTYILFLWSTILLINLLDFPNTRYRASSTTDLEFIKAYSNVTSCCRHCQSCVPLRGNVLDINYTNFNVSYSEVVRNAMLSLQKPSKRKDLQSHFEFISAATCIGICTYVFVEAYNNIENNGKKTSILWYVAPMGFHAMFMFVSNVSNIYFANFGMLIAIWFTSTSIVTIAYIILLLKLPVRRRSSYNSEDPKSHNEKKTTMKKSSMEIIQNGNLHFDSSQEKNMKKDSQDHRTNATLAPKATTQEDAKEEYYQHLHKILEDAQILYGSDSPCEPPYLKMWCRTFANSLNEDLEVHFDNTLFKTAKKFNINLYSNDQTKFEERCKEHHKKLKVVTFKFAYEAMEGWQKHGKDFPLEESRSLILSIASKWMTVVQEWIAKEETNLKPEEIEPDDEQKAWFTKAVERQKELNLGGIKEDSGSKLMMDKWILMGLTFGSFGANMMMKLVEKSG